jgi:hypothetical protein
MPAAPAPAHQARCLKKSLLRGCGIFKMYFVDKSRGARRYLPEVVVCGLDGLDEASPHVTAACVACGDGFMGIMSFACCVC